MSIPSFRTAAPTSSRSTAVCGCRAGDKGGDRALCARVRHRRRAVPYRGGTAAARRQRHRAPRPGGRRSADIWGRAGASVAQRCADASGRRRGLRIVSGRSSTALLRSARRCAGRGSGGDPSRVDARRPPTPPVRDLARWFDLSERQLRRRVEAAVGYSPRTLARILRFQRFLGAARSSGSSRPRPRPPRRRDGLRRPGAPHPRQPAARRPSPGGAAGLGGPAHRTRRMTRHA